MNPNITHVFPNASFVDLTIYQYGKEQCSPLLSCGPAIRNHYLLHYILSGKGSFTLMNEAEYQLTAGQAFLIAPHNIVSYVSDKKEPWSYIWVEFDGLKAASYLSEAGLTLKSPIYTPISTVDPGELETLLHFLIDHHDESPLKLIGTLYYILDALIRTSSAKKTSKVGNLQEFYTREAVNFIEQNYNKNITVNDIAHWCNLDRSYFGKIFKDTILVTPKEFLIQYRMNKACDLLKNTSQPIGDIAFAVGYDNQLHFSRAFKNVYKVSPREWRKERKD